MLFEKEHRLIYFGHGPEAAGGQPEDSEVQKAPEAREDVDTNNLETDEQVEAASEKMVQADGQKLQNIKNPLSLKNISEKANALREAANANDTTPEMKKRLLQQADRIEELAGVEPKTPPTQKTVLKEGTVEAPMEKPLTAQEAAKVFAEDFCKTMGIDDDGKKLVETLVQDPEFQKFTKGLFEKVFQEGEEPKTFTEFMDIFRTELKTAPESVKKQIKALENAIEKGVLEKNPDATPKDFAEAFKEFIKYFKEFLQELGVFEKANEKGEKEIQGDKKGLKKADKEYKEYNDNKEDMSSADKKKSLKKQKKAVDKHVKGAEKRLKSAKEKLVSVDDSIAKTQEELEAAKAEGAEGEEGAEDVTKLEKKLEDLKTEQEKAQKQVDERKELLEKFKDRQWSIATEMSDIEEGAEGAEEEEKNEAEESENMDSEEGPPKKAEAPPVAEEGGEGAQEHSSEIIDPEVLEQRQLALIEATAARVEAEAQYYNGDTTTENAQNLMSALEAEIEAQRQAGGSTEAIAALQHEGRRATKEYAATILNPLVQKLDDIYN